MKVRMLVINGILLLVACSGTNLSASLIEEGGDLQKTVQYEVQGVTHSFAATLTVADGMISDIAFEQGAASGRERAHQLAFFANIRPHIIGKDIQTVISNLPTVVGVGEEAKKLTGVFREEVLETLQ